MLKGNLTCEDISKLILPYIDDKLSQSTKNRVALHLRNCPFCMEKYRVIKTLFESVRQKEILRMKKFRQFRLLSAFCDNEVSKDMSDKIQGTLENSQTLTLKVHKIRTLRKVLNYGFEKTFSDVNLSFEKSVMTRVKKQGLIDKVKDFLSSCVLSQ